MAFNRMYFQYFKKIEILQIQFEIGNFNKKFEILYKILCDRPLVLKGAGDANSTSYKVSFPRGCHTNSHCTTICDCGQRHQSKVNSKVSPHSTVNEQFRL